MVRLGNEERATVNFFTRFARTAENNMGLREFETFGGYIDPKSGMPIKPRVLDRLDDHTLVTDLPESPPIGLEHLGPSYWEYLRGVTKAINAGDEPISGISDEAVDIVKSIMDAQKNLKTVPDLTPGIVEPMFDFSDALDSFWRTGRVDFLEGLDDVTVRKLVDQRQIWELDRVFTNRLDAQLQDVKWGMAHLEHLEKTDPERLIAILTDMTKVGEDAIPDNIATADIARKMLEALQ
jgi:hypothetical protein